MKHYLFFNIGSYIFSICNQTFNKKPILESFSDSIFFSQKFKDYFKNIFNLTIKKLQSRIFFSKIQVYIFQSLQLSVKTVLIKILLNTKVQ